MSINKKIVLTVAIGIAFGVSSCKKYLNVNTNPNGVAVPTTATLLPAAELYTGTALGVDMEIAGSFFAQYWTQSPSASQYHNLDQYAPGQDGFSTAWTNLYTANENYYQLYKLADSQKNKGAMIVSLLMRAYTFQLITDGFGDAPFSQALKGEYADGHIVNPKYDAQDSIYTGIIAMIDTANVLLAANMSSSAGGDLIYSGSMTQWQKFSNTLALKIYMRMSAVNPTAAQAGIAALYATNPVFIGPGDDAFIAYGSTSSNSNPLYAEEAGLSYTQNFVASASCIDTMINNSDPRIAVFYEPVQNTTSTFAGLEQGLYNGLYAGTASYPSVFVAGDAQNIFTYGSYKSGNAPVNFLTSYESLFLQAEAAARGWTTGNDDSLFYAAIAANFNYYDGQFNAATGNSGATNYTNYIAAGGNWTLYPAAGSTAQKIQYIITQKWFSMCGNQGFEAWSEWRRTGYPNFLVISASSIIGNNFPKRFTYPSTESTTNSNYPGLQPLTSKVWWDLL